MKPIYCLKMMKKGDTAPVVVAANQRDWNDLVPVKVHEEDGATYYYEGQAVPPVVRPKGWMMWIEDHNWPAWRVV